MVMGHLASLVTGSSILLPSFTFSGEQSMIASEKYGATSIYGVPTMFIEYLKEQ